VIAPRSKIIIVNLLCGEIYKNAKYVQLLKKT